MQLANLGQITPEIDSFFPKNKSKNNVQIKK